MSNKHKFILSLTLFLVSAPIFPSETDENFYGLEPPQFPSWLDDDQYRDDREVLRDIWNTMIQDFCRYGWDCLLYEREKAGNGTPDRYWKGPNCIDSANRFVEESKGGLPAGWSIFKVGALSKNDYKNNDGELGSCHSATVIRSPSNRYYFFDPYLGETGITELEKDNVPGVPGDKYKWKSPNKYYESKLVKPYKNFPWPFCSGGLMTWMGPPPSGIQRAETCPLPNQSSQPDEPVTVVGSFDPNDKTGINGIGINRFVLGTEEALHYSISFENLDTATAPAQEVVITDDLTPNTDALNLDTLALGPMMFGDKVVNPPPDQGQFSTDVDLRPHKNLLVRINASFDPATHILTWRFASIDPATGELTTDPLEGFLPPNTDANAPQGSGSVLFTVMPKPGLNTGTQIRNKASIVFDTNAPIVTPEWLNTLDNTKPASQVQSLPPIQFTDSLQVRWSGTDEGAGIKDYTIYVAEDGGTAKVWLTDTVATSGTFTGQFGRTYAFYSVARDLTGNVEDAPSSPDTATTTKPYQPPAIGPTNQTPVAQAGPDQVVKLGATVTLDGRSSVDPDQAPSPLAYRWIQTDGPAATLNGADTATPDFAPESPGIYSFSLTVSDGLATSSPVSVSVTVEDVPVLLLSPNGGETWQVKSVQTIRWHASGNSGKPLKIRFSKNGGKKWTLLKNANAASREFQWKPKLKHRSTRALVQICLAPAGKKAKPICDASHRFFEIRK